MIIRPYNPETDFDAVRRLWEEIAWIDRDTKEDAIYLEQFLCNANNLVAELNNQAECLVSSCKGTIRHLEHTLDMQIIAAVTTSLVARKQKLASRTTARAIAEGAESGLPVSILGMFEQGYYTRLGFGNGSYEQTVRFNPALLTVDAEFPVPHRLGVNDYAELHQSLMNRWRSHGSVQVLAPEKLHAELGLTRKPLGLGFRNEQGELTHFIWGSCKDEHGPLQITAMAYQNRNQLLQLLSLIKSLGNQLYLVQLTETQHVQLQDLLKEPFRSMHKTEGSKYAEYFSSEAWWQLRINDLIACMAATQLPARPTLAFNVSVHDPITQYLDDSQSWRGIGGDYSVQLGEQCSAQRNHQSGLPLLKATASGISRLWMGSANANRLATSGEIEADQSLLDELDVALNLPRPHPGWEF